MPGRPTKNVSRPQSNYLAAAVWSVKNFDRKRVTSHKKSVPPKSVVHFIFGLNVGCYKDSWVIWLYSDGVINWWLTDSFKSFLTTGTIGNNKVKNGYLGIMLSSELSFVTTVQTPTVTEYVENAKWQPFWSMQTCITKSACVAGAWK